MRLGMQRVFFGNAAALGSSGTEQRPYFGAAKEQPLGR